MSDRVSKELSASTKSLSESRECFIEVYIDNRWLIVIVYFGKLLKHYQMPKTVRTIEIMKKSSTTDI